MVASITFHHVHSYKYRILHFKYCGKIRGRFKFYRKEGGFPAAWPDHRRGPVTGGMVQAPCGRKCGQPHG